MLATAVIDLMERLVILHACLEYRMFLRVHRNRNRKKPWSHACRCHKCSNCRLLAEEVVEQRREYKSGAVTLAV